jgi:hypothetical protein
MRKIMTMLCNGMIQGKFGKCGEKHGGFCASSSRFCGAASSSRLKYGVLSLDMSCTKLSTFGSYNINYHLSATAFASKQLLPR